MELDGGIEIYLREIGKIELLTLAQEAELADRIKKGDPEARTHLIEASLPLVVKIAQDYADYGLPLLDIISEGNIGLTKAVDRFDPNKVGKLSTYAAWWINESIKRALANSSKTIRLPVPTVDEISKMRRVAMAMREELGREPTCDELSEETGTTRAKVTQRMTASMGPASLDALISDDDATDLGEIVGDDNVQIPFDPQSHRNMYSQINGLLTVLNEGERKIVDTCFGLNGQRVRTIEQIAEDFGVTCEQLRHLHDVALRKLRCALQKKERPIPKALRDAIPSPDGRETAHLIELDNAPSLTPGDENDKIPTDVPSRQNLERQIDDTLTNEMTTTERLLSEFKSEVERRATNLHQAALEIGVHYQSLYSAINYSKRSRPSSRPNFAYELGKRMEQWISKGSKTESDHANFPDLDGQANQEGMGND